MAKAGTGGSQHVRTPCRLGQFGQVQSIPVGLGRFGQFGRFNQSAPANKILETLAKRNESGRH